MPFLASRGALRYKNLHKGHRKFGDICPVHTSGLAVQNLLCESSNFVTHDAAFHSSISRTVTVEGCVAFEAMIEAEEPDAARKLVDGVELDPHQAAIFQLSGGTSGIPKVELASPSSSTATPGW